MSSNNLFKILTPPVSSYKQHKTWLLVLQGKFEGSKNGSTQKLTFTLVLQPISKHPTAKSREYCKK
jgi:hypothetical protein